MTWSFDVFFDLRLNKRLSKHSQGWWLETPSDPLWRHCNGWVDIHVFCLQVDGEEVSLPSQMYKGNDGHVFVEADGDYITLSSNVKRLCEPGQYQFVFYTLRPRQHGSLFADNIFIIPPPHEVVAVVVGGAGVVVGRVVGCGVWVKVGYTGFTLSVRPSVCRRHGFHSVTQVCFGISI